MSLHTSLRARTNVIGALVWLAMLAAVVFLLEGVPWTMVSLGLASGVGQGLLQRSALRAGASQLAQARSALEVRAALLSTTQGRWQIWIVWASLVLYVGALVVTRPEREPLDLIAMVFAAFLSEKAVREALTVGACRELEKTVAEAGPRA